MVPAAPAGREDTARRGRKAVGKSAMTRRTRACKRKTEPFLRETAEKRLDLKSLKGQTKAEELGPP